MPGRIKLQMGRFIAGFESVGDAKDTMTCSWSNAAFLRAFHTAALPVMAFAAHAGFAVIGGRTTEIEVAMREKCNKWGTAVHCPPATAASTSSDSTGLVSLAVWTGCMFLEAGYRLLGALLRKDPIFSSWQLQLKAMAEPPSCQSKRLHFRTSCRS